MKPDYPYQARERGIEGYVAVKVLVDTNAFQQRPSGAPGVALPAVAGDAHGIAIYRLGYCASYAGTAAASGSYLAWDRDRVQQALLALDTPVTLISGGGSARVGTDWLRALEEGGVAVRSIPGVEHFFDLAHAPELLDEVLRVITETDHG